MAGGLTRFTHRKALALSFDDGPGAVTADVLDLLSAHEARATFFLKGQAIVKRQEIARRTALDGHELGNHTFNHPRLGTLTTADLEQELRSTSDLIDEVAGRRPRLFRPPYGLDGLEAAPVARELGMVTVRWSVNPKDLLENVPERTADALIAGARHGAVAVLHDGGDDRHTLVRTLEIALSALKTMGFELITVSELLERSHRARRQIVVRHRSAPRRAIGTMRLRVARP